MKKGAQKTMKVLGWDARDVQDNVQLVKPDAFWSPNIFAKDTLVDTRFK